MPSKVLLIEDEVDTRDAIADLLKSRGLGVLSADEGRKALELMKAWRPAVILLDLHTSGMDGVAFRSAQQQDARLASIPVVVMTGDPDPEIRGDGLLEKPFMVEELLALLSRLVPEILPQRPGTASPARAMAGSADPLLGRRRRAGRTQRTPR